MLIIMKVYESKNVCTFTPKDNVKCYNMYCCFNTKPKNVPLTLILNSKLLCTTSDKSTIFIFSYVFIWFSIIHYYSCQVKFNLN